MRFWGTDYCYAGRPRNHEIAIGIVTKRKQDASDISTSPGDLGDLGEVDRGPWSHRLAVPADQQEGGGQLVGQNQTLEANITQRTSQVSAAGP